MFLPKSDGDRSSFKNFHINNNSILKPYRSVGNIFQFESSFFRALKIVINQFIEKLIVKLEPKKSCLVSIKTYKSSF